MNRYRIIALIYAVLLFGGLLGSGPVMPVNQVSPAKFIRRGGRIPAPLQSLKN